MSQSQVAALAVEHLDGDAAHDRLVRNDPGVGIQLGESLLLLNRREELLVDGVLALDAEHRNALEAHPLVQRDGALVVVQHRQVHLGTPPPRELRDQRSDQQPAHPWTGQRRVDGQTPKARAVFGIVEELRVVDAGDGADHGAGLVVRRHQIDHVGFVLAVAPHQVDVGGHHAALEVDLIGGRAIVDRLHRPDGEAWHVGRLVLAGPREREAVGEARVDEELLRMQGDEDVWRVEVHADVAPAAGLGPQRVSELVGVDERLAEHQPTPSEVLNDADLRLGFDVRRRHGTTPLT